ncbi:MAG: N-acetylneuraminate synthase family protein [Elusimicrobia bacterium]|nr:N-acetylneuraminate synthase family protein [Elusimicrobiota bacterium]
MSVFIIAELGINHNGDINIAKELINIAKRNGCDAVKFQKRTIDVVYTKEMLDHYRESPWGTTQRAQKEGLEFGKKQYDEIDRYCKEIGIEWFASAWDIASLEFLRQYNLKYNKIASTMLTHMEFVEAVAAEGKKTFIATGMSTLEDIDRVVDVFKKKKCPFVLMHCVSVYPAADDELNLSCIKTLKDRYKCEVGYSGHETGILASVLAVTMGAVAIERHITVNRTMYGSDQAASLEEHGLHYVVRDIRRLPMLLGDGKKVFGEKERKVANKLRYWRPAEDAE